MSDSILSSPRDGWPVTLIWSQCCYCRRTLNVPASYSLNSRSFDSGPVMPLCYACGGGGFPTLDQIRDRHQARMTALET